MKRAIWFLLFLFSTSAFTQNTPYITITVAQDGSGNFTSIQKAINSIRDLGPAEALVKIKAGVYNEKIVIPSSKHLISLQGESAASTIISNNDFSGKINPATQDKMTTFNSYTLLITGDDIKLENLTIRNTSCNEGQAVSLHVEGDRFSAVNCNITGCQDTLYTATSHSRQFYKNCHIEGTTDFIFGQATVVFSDCTIKNLSDSYITAAATTPKQQYGYVFFNCNIIAKEGITKCYLGRPWRPYAKTVFIDCSMDKHILPEGWHPWDGDKMFPDKQKTCYYAEYNSKGSGASPSKRVSWSHQLSKKELKNYTPLQIVAGTDNWVPR
jgi:pectinesterase